MIASVIQATGLAAASMAEVAGELTVDKLRMRANIEATRGVIFAERAMMLLGEILGRDIAHKILEEATRKSTKEKKSLAQVLGEMKEVKDHLGAATLRDLEKPEHYLGMADEFCARLMKPPKTRGKE